MINSQASSSDCQRPPVTVIASLVKRKKTLFYNQHVNDTTLSLQRPTGLFIYAGRTVVLILYIDVSRCPQCYRLPAPFPVHVPLVAFFTREFVWVLPVLPSLFSGLTGWTSPTGSKGSQLSEDDHTQRTALRFKFWRCVMCHHFCVWAHITPLLLLRSMCVRPSTSPHNTVSFLYNVTKLAHSAAYVTSRWVWIYWKKDVNYSYCLSFELLPFQFSIYC